MSNGLLALERSTTVVREWIEQAIALVQPIAEQREQTILLDCPRPSPIVIGDAFRLSQVMVNLLTNASRYGAWGDTIAITVIDEGDAVTVRVSDHGPGIPAYEREKIFRPRVRGSRAAEYAEGQGLGLHIVAGIVAQHGGTVDVSSETGRGTTFWIRLPTERG
jgi:signal transduction histidine kinase